MQVLHNGVEPAAGPSGADRHRARQQLRLDDRAFVVATVARLDPVKDLMTLFEAFAKVRQRVPSAQLLVVGDGPERNRLTARAEQPDLTGSVHLAGYRSDVRALLPAADVTRRSISEGVSITILEACRGHSGRRDRGVGGPPRSSRRECRRHSRPVPRSLRLARPSCRWRTTTSTRAWRRPDGAARTLIPTTRMVDDYSRLYRGRQADPMCGICGVVAPDGELHPALRSAIGSMAATLHHRGPDGQGVFSDAFAALGHRRLAIIDRAGGHQPMFNEDGSCWVVFNGEIYNHRSLRSRLIGLGHTFKTSSDTETILHAYEEYGADCVPMFEGMFAFAVYDSRRRSCCRADRGQETAYSTPTRAARCTLPRDQGAARQTGVGPDARSVGARSYCR